MKAARVSPQAPPRRSAGQARAALLERLRERREELNEAVLARVYGVSDPSETADPEYIAGLRAAVGAALDYAFAGLELGERRQAPVPAPLLVQARIAARNGVSLDTVLRRYFAGYALLADLLIEEAEAGGLLEGAELQRLLRNQARQLDRLVAAVSEEHGRDVQSGLETAEQRRLGLVGRLLGGELLDPTELAYDLEALHLGLVASGPGAAGALRNLARNLDCRLLLVRPDERTVWTWFGGWPADRDDLDALFAEVVPPEVSLAAGQPGRGLAGWRLSHRQARAALPIALHGPLRFIRYADVAILASTLRDDLLATSLRQIYLEPLERERDGGAALRETLRAYLASGGNASSAAAALGLNRKTVANRLRTAEKLIGRPLDRCVAELSAVLRLKLLADPRR